MKDKSGGGKLVGDSMASQNASLREGCPGSTDSHKKPGVMPIGGKANTGYRPY